jgi:hypothetical protein
VRDVAYTGEEAQLWWVPLRPFLAPPPGTSMHSVSWPKAAAHSPTSRMIADATQVSGVGTARCRASIGQPFDECTIQERSAICMRHSRNQRHVFVEPNGAFSFAPSVNHSSLSLSLRSYMVACSASAPGRLACSSQLRPPHRGVMLLSPQQMRNGRINNQMR